MTILPRYWMLLQRSLSFVNFSFRWRFSVLMQFCMFHDRMNICLEQNDSEIPLALYIRLQFSGT